MKSSSVLYDDIGNGYNTTRQADPYIARKIFQLLSHEIEGLYLDVGCGTGNYTIALANEGLDFYGVEPSEEMLKIARSKNNRVKWLQGRSEQIPANDELFNGVIATLTIHHWADLGKAFGEIYRVLKPNGKMVLYTALPEQMRGYWLNHYFPVMLEESILQMPSFDNIKDAAINTGLKVTATEKYFISDNLKDLFLYSGKNKPELYLDGEVRKGISSFSALANAGEVQSGLSKLAEDIESGRFEDIKAEFDNGLGDYLFIVLQKN